MKREKRKQPERPERSYVETPLLTGQYPAFGIEIPQTEAEPSGKRNKKAAADCFSRRSVLK